CSTVARLGVSTYAQSHAPCFFHRDRLGFTEPSRRGPARLLRGRPPPSALSPPRRLARHPACLGFARARRRALASVHRGNGLLRIRPDYAQRAQPDQESPRRTHAPLEASTPCD